jgi:hypothetical protein
MGKFSPPHHCTETHHKCCNGCSGGLVINPGVCGSSMGSASGGTAVPSTLRVRVRAYRAVMASSVGIFLNTLAFLGCLSSPAVSCASFSTFSTVRGSPGPMVTVAEGRASPLTEPLVELGGEVDSAAGDVERVMGALTATESAKDVVVESEVWEPVRRKEAARRGRFAGWVD